MEKLRKNREKTPRDFSSSFNKMWFQPFDQIYKKDLEGNVTFGLCTNSNSNGSLDIAWHPTGKIETVSEKAKGQLRLSDRYFHPGQFVSSPTNRLGYVLSVDMFPTLQILGTNYVVASASSKRLCRVQGYRPGDIILCHHNWVGEVTRVKASVRLQMKDDTRVVDWDTLASELEETGDPFRRSDVFYPGLGMKMCRWKSKDPIADFGFLQSYVKEVWADELEVVWLNSVQKPGAGGLFTKGKVEKPPPTRVIGREEISQLARLKPFDYLAIQLGSIRLMRLDERDLVLDKDSWVKNPFEKSKAPHLPFEPLAVQSEPTPVEVLRTFTAVTLLWTDTNEKEVVRGVELKELKTQGLQLYPTGFVQDESNLSRVGILLEMNLRRCVGEVAYFDLGSRDITKVDIVSLYDLRPHPNIQLRPGTIVTIQISDTLSIFGYVLFFDPKGLQVRVHTEKGEGFVDIYKVKPLALRYPREYSLENSLEPTPGSKDSEMREDEVEGANSIGWSSKDLKELSRAFVMSRIMNLCLEVNPEHHFLNYPGTLRNWERLKRRMNYEFIRLTPLSSFLQIKAFFSRMMNLYSVMMQGKPVRGPYANFLFIFDLYIPPEYPGVPPRVKLFSPSPAILSPFISKDGTVEIPILKKRFWSPNFTLDKVIFMIRDVLSLRLPALAPEVRDAELDLDNWMEAVGTAMDVHAVPFRACRYNEALFLNLLTYTEALVTRPPRTWLNEIPKYFSSPVQQKYFKDIESWLEEWKKESMEDLRSEEETSQLGAPFPILPISVGGGMSLKGRLEKLIAAFPPTFQR